MKCKSTNFIKEGFKDFKNAVEKLQKHEKTPKHQLSFTLWKTAQNKDQWIGPRVKSQHDEEVAVNRYNLSRIVDCIYFLSK